MLDRSQLPATYNDERGFNPKGKAASGSRPSTARLTIGQIPPPHVAKSAGPAPDFPAVTAANTSPPPHTQPRKNKNFYGEHLTLTTRIVQ